MPWFCLKTGWRKRTVRLIGYIIPRRNVYVNSTEALIRYLFPKWRLNIFPRHFDTLLIIHHSQKQADSFIVFPIGNFSTGTECKYRAHYTLQAR